MTASYACSSMRWTTSSLIPDDFLIYLSKTLPRRVNCQLMLIMLTNRLDWEKSLDPRIMSCLKKTDIIFEPYDALDLLAILQLRVEKALDQNKVEEGALQKIAAYASKETGRRQKGGRAIGQGGKSGRGEQRPAQLRRRWILPRSAWRWIRPRR